MRWWRVGRRVAVRAVALLCAFDEASAQGQTGPRTGGTGDSRGPDVVVRAVRTDVAQIDQEDLDDPGAPQAIPGRGR